MVLLALTAPAQAVMYEATPLETLSIDSRLNVHAIGQPKVNSKPLAAGIWYKFVASGEWTPDFNYTNPVKTLSELNADTSLLYTDPWRVDARWASQDNWTQHQDTDPKGYIANPGLFSQLLGGAETDHFWGNYQPTHVYSSEFLGTGVSADFFVSDINSYDNFGVYTVQVYRQVMAPPGVPGPWPIGGAALALTMSRRLRQCIKR